jgi:hypothetical protein
VLLFDMSGDGRREVAIAPHNAFVELLYASSPSEDSDVGYCCFVFFFCVNIFWFFKRQPM